MQAVPPRVEEMVIDPARVETSGDATTVTYTIRWGKQTRDVWFKAKGAPVQPSGSAALTLGLLAAMRTSRSLHISDPVSPRLLKSQSQIQDVMAVWDYQFEHVRVVAPKVEAAHDGGSGIATFFSGGIDSFFTLLHRVDEITHLIFVHGFDIPLSRAALSATVAGELRGIADEFKKPLVEVWTNLREFLDEFGDWGEHTHGAALAAVGLMLQPAMRKIYISSSHPYTALFRWGSHPLIDPQWSTESLEIEHFGTATPRIGKIAFVMEDPIAQRTLRVCWQNPGDAYNCGKCGKCTRTMINLKAVGALEKARTFKNPLTLEQVREMKIASLSLGTFTLECLRATEARGGDPELEEAIKHAMGWWYKKLDEEERKKKRPEIPRAEEMQIGQALQRVDEDGSTTITFPIQWGTQRQDAWFTVKGATAAPSDTAAITLSLVPAMRTAKSLRVAGPVSPKLMAALPQIQELFAAWGQEFKEIPVHAPSLDSSSVTPAAGVGVFFSGGVDSFFSLLRHVDEITHLIFVQGFDIKLKKQELAGEVLQVIRSIAKELNKPLIEVTTNLRDFSDPLVDWGEDYNGAALATVAQLLAPTLKKAYIASSHPYSDMFRWGSHPLLDHLYSSEAVEINHDGCDATRVKKVGAIAHHPTVQRTLRVCYRNKDGAYNCGLCEKCLRTMVNLRVAGALEKCQTFKRPLKLGEVRLIHVKDENTASFVSENLRAVEAKGDDPKLAQALREALSRRYYRKFGHIVRAVIDLKNRMERKFEK